jgi:hypothetical protein
MGKPTGLAKEQRRALDRLKGKRFFIGEAPKLLTTKNERSHK